jgi:hypothetical protein
LKVQGTTRSNSEKQQWSEGPHNCWSFQATLHLLPAEQSCATELYTLVPTLPKPPTNSTPYLHLSVPCRFHDRCLVITITTMTAPRRTWVALGENLVPNTDVNWLVRTLKGG